MLARFLCLLAALSCALPLRADSVSVLLDRSSVVPAGDSPAGRDERALLVQTLAPRIGVRSHALPLAWFAEGNEVSLEPALTAELRAAMEDFDAAGRVAERLARHAESAGEALARLSSDELARFLLVETRGTGGAGQHRIATVRVLTRGNVRDRWTVRPEISSPEADAVPPDLPARHLLTVDVVSLGLHLFSDDESLPDRLAHVGLRARLWNLPGGRREWDRALLLGLRVPDDGEDGGAFRARAERLLDDGADRLAAELWPELAIAPEAPAPLEGGEPVAPRVEAPAVAEAVPSLSPVDVQAPPRDGRALLLTLAEARLSEPPAGEPWPALAAAVRPELSPALATALGCAEDPLGAAVETGSRRLGLGLADTYRRVESSSAFRRALASDLLDQVIEASGDDWPLERAVRYLLADLLEQPAPGREAPSVAEPLLQRARLDRARSAEGLASLLIGLRIWPEGGEALLQELVDP